MTCIEDARVFKVRVFGIFQCWFGSTMVCALQIFEQLGIIALIMADIHGGFYAMVKEYSRSNSHWVINPEPALELLSIEFADNDPTLMNQYKPGETVMTLLEGTSDPAKKELLRPFQAKLVDQHLLICSNQCPLPRNRTIQSTEYTQTIIEIRFPSTQPQSLAQVINDHFNLGYESEGKSLAFNYY